jgi:hypothetical protein
MAVAEIRMAVAEIRMAVAEIRMAVAEIRMAVAEIRMAGPAVLAAAAPETKGTRAWAGEVVSSSSPGCPTRHRWKGG